MHKHTLQSYAKINLFLEVIKKLKNGYHDLSSIITRISISDKIKIDTAANFSVKFIGPFCSQVSQESNIHTLFQFLLDNNFINHSNYAILIDKQIPVGSGLGGGSSNVAEILKYLMSEGVLSKSQCLLVAKELGSDIEFFLEEGSALITGTGSVKKRIKLFSDKIFLLIYPQILSSTKIIFEQHQILSKSNFLYEGQKQISDILQETSNDLEKTALTLHQETRMVKQFLESDERCNFTRMTGSGSAFFGCYNDEAIANEAVSKIKKLHPKWWTCLARTI